MTRGSPYPGGAFLALTVLAGCAEQPIQGSPPAAQALPAARQSEAAAPRVSRRKGDERPEFYVVQRGDTLFGIALDFGFDYRDLSQWNALADPGRILVGQRLRLTPPPPPPEEPEVRARGGPAVFQEEALPVTPAPGVGSPTGSAPGPALPRLSEPRARTVPFSAQTLARWQKGAVADEEKPGAGTEPGAVAETQPKQVKPATVSPPATPGASAKEAPPREGPAAKDPPATEATAKEPATQGSTRPAPERDDDEALEWSWPVRGDLLYRFGESGRLKGVGIGGRAGQPVGAAATGRVVYAGSGLRGYGRMVIVKHNETYLSVYAHNSALLVKEGDGVKRGQKIAEMGDTDASRVGLHFEVRRFGRPIDPLGRLPGL